MQTAAATTKLTVDHPETAEMSDPQEKSPAPIPSLHLMSTSSNESSSPSDDKPGKTGEKRHRGPVSRRGHVKSRLGCFSCKRRRVKCNELRPSCTSCHRLGLRCEYPTQALGTASEVGTAVAVATPQSPLNGLALEDLRFYHQFLTVGYPAIPLKAQEAWNQAAAMSHQYDFLAHALLGLGASHITQHNPGLDYTASALQHRLVAIKRVNEEIVRRERSPVDADALFATVICLVAQSGLIATQDSMVEYLTMVRGGNLIVTQILPDFDKSLFAGMTMERHMSTLGELTTNLPPDPLDFELVEEFEVAVEGLRPLLRCPPEHRYLDAILGCTDGVRFTATRAWMEFVGFWLMPTSFTHPEFNDFTQPANHPARMLMVYGFLLEYLLGQICISPDLAPKCGRRKDVVVSWTRSVAESIPDELKPHMEWALMYCNCMESQDSRYLMSP